MPTLLQHVGLSCQISEKLCLGPNLSLPGDNWRGRKEFSQLVSRVEDRLTPENISWEDNMFKRNETCAPCVGLPVVQQCLPKGPFTRENSFPTATQEGSASNIYTRINHLAEQEEAEARRGYEERPKQHSWNPSTSCFCYEKSPLQIFIQ